MKISQSSEQIRIYVPTIEEKSSWIQFQYACERMCMFIAMVYLATVKFRVL